MLTGSLFSQIKSGLMTLAAVLLVLVGAYSLGGRAARQALEEKARREDNRRLQNTVDEKNETINEIRRKGASVVHHELHDKWMRD